MSSMVGPEESGESETGSAVAGSEAGSPEVVTDGFDDEVDESDVVDEGVCDSDEVSFNTTFSCGLGSVFSGMIFS